MSLLFSLFGSGGHLLAGVGIVIMALIVSWFGGKNSGRVAEKARGEIDDAHDETTRIATIAKKQAENILEANHVQTANGSLSDAAARNKLRQSSHNKG